MNLNWTIGLVPLPYRQRAIGRSGGNRQGLRYVLLGISSRKKAEHLLATADMTDALDAVGRRHPLARERHPSPPPACPTPMSDLARVMHAFEDRHREDRRAAAEREERAEARALAREAEYRAERLLCRSPGE
jgi:hypothetical protein